MVLKEQVNFPHSWGSWLQSGCCQATGPVVTGSLMSLNLEFQSVKGWETLGKQSKKKWLHFFLWSMPLWIIFTKVILCVHYPKCVIFLWPRYPGKSDLALGNDVSVLKDSRFLCWRARCCLLIESYNPSVIL